MSRNRVSSQTATTTTATRARTDTRSTPSTAPPAASAAMIPMNAPATRTMPTEGSREMTTSPTTFERTCAQSSDTVKLVPMTDREIATMSRPVVMIDARYTPSEMSSACESCPAIPSRPSSAEVCEVPDPSKTVTTPSSSHWLAEGAST